MHGTAQAKANVSFYYSLSKNNKCQNWQAELIKS